MPVARQRGRSWRRLRAHILATHPPICAGCGELIDLSLPKGHPMAPEVDHIIPVALGGPEMDPTNLTPMHRCHNRQKGTGTPPPKASRTW